jgi:uncharacterized membrane protein
MTQGQIWMTAAAAVGSGAMGGVFFAFSSFVMPALHRLAPSGAIEAMNSINVMAPRAPFMAPLFGTAALCCALVVVSYRSWGSASATWLAAGCALYLLGPILLTMAVHVPLNDTLAAAHPHADDAAQKWSDYYDSWVPLNHLRALGGIGAAAAFTAALV